MGRLQALPSVQWEILFVLPAQMELSESGACNKNEALPQ
jgi:hypothetical protein